MTNRSHKQSYLWEVWWPWRCHWARSESTGLSQAEPISYHNRSSLSFRTFNFMSFGEFGRQMCPIEYFLSPYCTVYSIWQTFKKYHIIWQTVKYINVSDSCLSPILLSFFSSFLLILINKKDTIHVPLFPIAGMTHLEL